MSQKNNDGHSSGHGEQDPSGTDRVEVKFVEPGALPDTIDEELMYVGLPCGWTPIMEAVHTEGFDELPEDSAFLIKLGAELIK